ncbi:MAG TPA: acylphosphatase [Sphingomicrobium sp.]|nr:acylphosphatase [Sphingomicrobium sp.]
MIARRVRVTGRVQGVFFRAWTRDEARRLGVSGWVRNCDDGSVEAHVEGDEAAVEQLIGKMRNGPPDAHVTDFQVSNAAAAGSGSFDVRD